MSPDRCSRFVRLLALLASVLVAGTAFSDERVRFHVVTLEESDSARNVLSEATIAGPQGTDFEIELRGGRFKMTARFLTGAVASGAMDVRAILDTRRHYGYSERNLPLYEEDTQTHALEVDLREQIVLLPFGSPAGDERLKIEITPALIPAADPAAAGQDLEIDILKPAPDGSVQVRAFVVPHRFVFDAVLLRDGVEVAWGTGRSLIGATGSIRLTGSGREPSIFDIDVGVRKVLRERPTDLILFDYRSTAGRGAGVTPLGVPVDLELSFPDDLNRSSHVLRLFVRTAEAD